jgi:autotransporter-associated beta strand protein
LLKFTSAPISNGATTSHVTLQGTGNGEFVGGLPFAFTNFTKSGNGTWTLGGAVGNTGITTVSGGTLALQNKSSIMGGNTANWTAAKIVVNSGATLAVNVGGAGELNHGDVTTLLTNLGGLGGAINNNGLRSGSSIGFDTTNATGGSFTIANNLSNATGTGSGAIGLTKRGTGKLILSGTNTYSGVTTVSAGTLEINGSVTSASAVVNGVLAGSGVLTNATLSGSGSIDPGSSPGILTASDLDPSGGLDFNFEFTQKGVTPNWDVATASINDVMRLTDGSTPFNTGLTAANVISIYLNVASVSGGDTFTGGFFTDRNSDFLSSISSATFLYMLADPLGTEYNGVTYSAYSGPLTFTVDTIPQTADFTSGTVSGYSMQITAAIPETSTALLGAIGALALLRRRRR